MGRRRRGSSSGSSASSSSRRDFASDTSGRVTLVNRPLEELTGLSRSALESVPVAQLATTLNLGPSETQVFSMADLPLRRVLDYETCVDVPATLVNVRTGVRTFVSITSAPIIGANGEVAGAVSVVHDVTATVQLESMKEQFAFVWLPTS